MKGRAIIFTIVMGLSLFSNAQERGFLGLFRKSNSEFSSNFQSPTWGGINKKGAYELANVIIAQDNNQFYTWSGYDGYYYESAPVLRAFNHEGGLIYSSTLQDDYIDFIHLNNRLYYVSKTDSSENLIVISIQEINKSDGTPKGIKRELFTTKKVKKVPFVPYQFNYTISPDHKHLVVTLLSSSMESLETPDNISIQAFDQNLRLNWKFDKHSFSEGQSFHIMSMVVDNSGTLYLATQLFDDASSISDGHAVKLFTLDKQGKRIRDLELEYWGITIVDFVMKIKGVRVLGTGIYNSTANYSRVKGVLLVELDSYHNEYMRLYSEDIPLDIIGEFIEKKKVEELKEFGQVYLNDVLLGEDGSVTLFVQEGNRLPLYGRYPRTRLLTIDDSSPEPHSYGNLLVTKFSASGRLAYMKVIKKKLTTSFTQQRMGAYSMFAYNGATYIFYYKGRFPSRSNPIIRTRISDRGTVTSEKFLKSSKPGLFICPRFFYRSAKDNSLLLYAQMTSKFQYGKVLIK